MSLETAQKVIVLQKKNYVPHFLKQRDINSYYTLYVHFPVKLFRSHKTAKKTVITVITDLDPGGPITYGSNGTLIKSGFLPFSSVFSNSCDCNILKIWWQHATLFGLFLTHFDLFLFIFCTICRVFPREKSLQAHLRTHTGERPYTCDYPACSRYIT
jgi:hypothetical protein